MASFNAHQTARGLQTLWSRGEYSRVVTAVRALSTNDGFRTKVITKFVAGLDEEDKKTWKQYWKE